MRTELERLLEGVQPTETPGGMGTVRFIAVCEGNAADVLKTCRPIKGDGDRSKGTGVVFQFCDRKMKMG